MTTTAPIKISQQTDRLVTQAAHFLAHSKKDIVDLAVREYIDNHRDEINAGVRAALQQFDGTRATQLSVLTGMTKDEIDEVLADLHYFAREVLRAPDTS